MKKFFSIITIGLLLLNKSGIALAQTSNQTPAARVCPNSPIVLKANATNGSDSDGGFTWYKDGQQIVGVPNTNSDSLVITEPGSYTLVSKSGFGCSSPVSVPIVIASKQLTAVNDSVVASIGSSVQISVVANDLAGCDAINTTSTTIESNPMFGMVQANPNGSISYTSFGGFSNIDSFKYKVEDINGNTSNIATVFVTMRSNTPLAINLLNFNVEEQASQQVLLNWQVAGEGKSIVFTLERSADAKAFEAIGTLNAKPEAGINSSFTFTDRQPRSGRNFYRLKITDNDGTVSYSAVKMINLSLSKSISLYPNPASDKVFIKSNSGLPEWIQLYDMYGKQLQTVVPSSNLEILQLSHLPAGFYIIKVKTHDSNLEVFKFNKI